MATTTSNFIRWSSLDQRWAVERIAPLDARGILGVQEHVHASQGPGSAVHLLPVESEVVRADLFGGTNQKGTGTAGWVADGVSRYGCDQLCQQPGDGGRSVELSGLLAGVRREAEIR